jgi:solute carrier family 50 protein (sugar transporter)
VRTRNSASLFWPLSVMNTINGCLWTAYGFAVKDAFIYAPNAVGTVCGAIQLLLICSFPARVITR